MAVDLHHSSAFVDEIELFGKLVVVPLGRSSGGNASFRKALVLHWSIGPIEEASKGGTIPGRERGLRVDMLDPHEIRLSVCACAIKPGLWSGTRST